jgi:hypothetical protein
MERSVRVGLRSRAIAAGMVLLLGGGIMGSALTRALDLRQARQWLTSSAGSRRTQLVEFALRQRLDLTADQAQRLHDVLLAQEPEIDALWTAQFGERAALRRSMLTQLGTFLNADQQQHAEALVRELERRESRDAVDR